MRYQELQPGLELERFVECYWTLENERPDLTSKPEPILPDGCVEVILNLADNFNEHRGDGVKVSQPMYFLVGQMTRPIFIAPTGRVRLIGIRFQPGGAFPLLRVPMHELTDGLVELGALDPMLEGELKEAVSDERSLPRCIARIERSLFARA